ncbi:hypothetical protein [Pseudomonas nitroreducens]|uniref:hypothetical protein n=1 Tax=Pseudomonas nitroreducens TaxID=46680 RepID=UPI003D2834FF
MIKPQPDFEYIRDLLDEFFKKRSIKAAFKIINQQEITGWEIWLQIEFARFLAEHASEPEWWRETPLKFDYRREKTGYFLKPDFIIRKKHWPLESYVALEIKQHQHAGNCVANMISDLEKVAKIRKSELNVRSLWALGIFCTEPDACIFELIETKLQSRGLEYHESRTKAAPISGTAFSYALF